MEYSFGDRGFIGATGLYLNKTTLDQRVRLGQEPVRNIIWDINTQMNFKPNFITKILDFIPVLETSAESRLKIEAEYAQVNPNPNTFNEEKLGENNGVAYIDDFEGSKRTTPLGIIYRGWSRGSIPRRFRIPSKNIDYEINPSDDTLMYRLDKARLRMFWYNPFDQVNIRDIWPNRDVNAQTGTTTNVLVLQWKNDSIPDSLAWAGIMRSTVNFPDQKKTKFIEMWVKGDKGRVNIDIGKISEDFYIREGTFNFDNRASLGNLNTEDRNLNGLLDFDEDIGLDGIPEGQPNADPFDIWAPPQNSSPPFLQINGTERNGEAQGAKYPDTEDLDGNGGLNQTNEYFTYSFDLSDKFHPYINGSTAAGWTLYRIPIRAFDPDLVVGNPDTTFQQIFNVRLWLNDLPIKPGDYDTLAIATFDFVGNEWEETGVAADENSPFELNDSLFSITVYNTEENAEPPQSYVSPPGVTGIEDRITRAVSKEQSLVMQLRELPPQAIAEANKQLFEKMDLINYKKLKLFVHGSPDLPATDSPLEFYLRFGPAEGIFYEIGTKVYPGWDERNFLDVVLDELAKTKDDAFFIGDSLNEVYLRQNPDNPNQYFKVRGKPNLRNLNFIEIGARNVGTTVIQGSEIWIDEFRVTDVFRDKGTAMRLVTDLALADVATFRAQWEVVDADFRRIEDQFGTGNTTERQDYRLSLNVNKFLPSSWGFRIPLSGSYVKTRNIPKYFYNTDQLTKYRADSFVEKLEQFFGMAELDPELEANSRISETQSLGGTFSRQGNPRTPWFLKYSVDMFTLDVDWSQSEATDERYDLNTNQKISGRLQARVPLGKDNTFQPFSWLGRGPIVRLLSGERVGYLPTSLDASVSVNDNETVQKARLEQNPTETIRTTSSRRFGVAYNLVPSITMNFSRDYQSDAFLDSMRISDLIESIFTKFDFGTDKVMSQNFSANYSPGWFSWSNQSFKYSSAFNYSFSNVTTNEKSSSRQISKGLNVSLQPSQLANKIYDPRKSQLGRQQPGATSRPRGRPGRQPGTSDDPSGEKGNEQGDPKGEEEESPTPRKSRSKTISALNPLKLVWHFFNAWKSVGVDYQVRDNASNFNIAEMPGFNYQLGFTDDIGVATDTTFGKLAVAPSLKNSEILGGNLGFDIIKNLSSSFKYNFASDLTQNNQLKTENNSSTYFYVGDDPENNQKEWYKLVPDWQFRLSGVEKLFIFKRFANSVQIEHARSGKSNETIRYDGEEQTKTNWGYSNSYSPFLGISITSKWGVTGNIRYTTSSNFTYSATSGDNKSVRSGFDVTLSYSKSTGFRIPLPFLNKKRLKNEMQFSLAVNNSNDVTFARRSGIGSEEFIEQNKNKSLKFKPSMTYRFSQKVNGSMFFEYSTNETKRTGKFSYFEFGVNVNIAIR
jgi:hypothetical protein